jgi:hypothetical protein
MIFFWRRGKISDQKLADLTEGLRDFPRSLQANAPQFPEVLNYLLSSPSFDDEEYELKAASLNIHV